MLFLYMKVVIYPDNLLLEKPFKPDLLYNTVVHFYIDKKGFSKDKANAIAQAVVKKRRKEEYAKMKHADTLHTTISEMQRYV